MACMNMEGRVRGSVSIMSTSWCLTSRLFGLIFFVQVLYDIMVLLHVYSDLKTVY